MLDGIVEVFDQGGVVMWLIAIISFIGTALITDRFFYYIRVLQETSAFMGLTFPSAIKGEIPEKYPDSPIVNVLMAGLIHLKRPVEEAEALMREAAFGELPKMEKYLSTIAVIGSILPMLGLLGTVVGMIGTFTVISVQGTGDPSAMAGGISKALITTEAGLITAIPFMFLHNHLSNRYNNLVALMEKETTRILTLAGKGEKE